MWEEDEIARDAYRYDDWELRTKNVMWFDTAGCLPGNGGSGKHVGEANYQQWSVWSKGTVTKEAFAAHGQTPISGQTAPSLG